MNNAASTKVQAYKITLIRQEGTVQEVRDGLAVLVGDNVFLHANDRLRAWRRTAPVRGYHKCRFIVEYADGETYEGRIDLRQGEPVSLGDHMRLHLERASGRATPPGRTEEQWGAYLRDVVGAERVAAAGAFLDGYEVSGWNQ